MRWARRFVRAVGVGVAILTKGGKDREQESTSSAPATRDASHSGLRSGPGNFWDSLLLIYLVGGYFIGWLAAIITFIAVYIAAIRSVGWVIGIALGWIPAGIAAAIVGWLVGALWPLLVIGLAVVIYEVAG
jgi:hypothetical protein